MRLEKNMWPLEYAYTAHWNNGKKMPIHVMPRYVVSAIPEPEELTSLPLNLDLGLLISIKLLFCLHLLQDLRLGEYTIVITHK